MSVVMGALGSLAPKLLQLLHDEYKVQKGVRKQVQWLSSELDSVNAFLRKVADVPWDRLDEQVKVWARQVREASYDMEDILDTYLVRVNCGEPAYPSRLKRALKKMGKLFGKVKSRYDIAGAIEDMRMHLEEVARRRQNYKLDEIMAKPVVSSSAIDPRLSAMYKEVTQLIGIVKSRDQLISMLMPSQQDEDASHPKKITRKVSIVGVGGLGKTTLAKAVYDKLKLQYDCVAFVSVGRDLEFVRVFKDMLFDFDEYKYGNIHNTGRGVDLLIRELRKFLENKRYFVVVDDVWEVKTWEIIKLALVENNYGSGVITTTRKFDVAKEVGEVYKLQPLSYDNSKKLFYTRIFSADGKYLDNQQDDVCDKILKKCDGIPLAIITVSSLLVGKPKDEWSVVNNSIGFGHNKNNRDVENTMMILSFSYYDLPSHLRTCLLYLSTYPEDYFIRKDSLIRRWIAEGFVSGKQGKVLYELGEGYFNDLINRSMIQAVEDEWDGRVVGCRVHDMVLDLMREFSLEENFIAPLDDNVEATSSPTSNVRRVAHQNRTAEQISSEAKDIEMPKVRSYTAFKCYINNLVQFTSFKLLRVLDILECSFKDGYHLEHLGNLLHLRYLGLICKDIPELPKNIGNLKLLQTLQVCGLREKELPASIVMLTQLVRLCGVLDIPDRIGMLESLEELLIQGCGNRPERFVKDLGRLRQLRALRFSTTGKPGMDESMQRDFVKSLRDLQKVKYIELEGTSWEANTAMWEASGFVLPRSLRHLSLRSITFSKLPSCINPSRLPNLSYLKLRVTTMDEQDLKLLARLPALCLLELGTRSTVRVTASISINAGDNYFQKLRYFNINAMIQFQQPNEESSVLMHIWNGDGVTPFSSGKSNCSKVCAVMPNLEVLEFDVPLRALKDGNNGDLCNFGLEYLPSLRDVRGTIYGGFDVSAAEAALRNACRVHPNLPSLHMRRVPKEYDNVSTKEEHGEKQQDGQEEASQTADIFSLACSLTGVYDAR